MSEILFVNACPRPGSRTLELARALLARLPGNITEADLFAAPAAPLDLAGLAKREQAAAAGDHSAPAFAYARQFAQADTVVIAAPYWDLMFPGALKNYLEAITVSGLTFRYTPQGFPQGLCRARRLYYVTTAGGYIRDNDFGFRYVKALAESFYGISQVYELSAQGLDILGNDPVAILDAAKGRIDELV